MNSTTNTCPVLNGIAFAIGCFGINLNNKKGNQLVSNGGFTGGPELGNFSMKIHWQLVTIRIPFNCYRSFVTTIGIQAIKNPAGGAGRV
jgi:hypothetical protein